MLSPRDHPNAAAALGSGSVAAFIIYEIQNRAGFELYGPEQTMIVALVAFLYLVLGGRVKIR